MREKKLGQGQSVQGFDSMEEMTAYLMQQERQAIENALPEQWNITWGARVVRIVDKLAIFGQIYTEREFLAENTKAGEAPSEEILYELDDLRNAHQRGYRYGRWYSVVEPEGEYGSAHVSTLWEITTLDFDTARAGGWVIWSDLAERLYAEQSQAITNHEEEEEK
jgi:hypothetical protein